MKSITGREFCRVLERHGWELIRVTGSHHIYVSTSSEPIRVVVPVHGSKDLKRGLLASLLKHTQLTEEDL